MAQVYQFSENSDYIFRSGIHLENPSIHTVHFSSSLELNLETIFQHIKTSETLDTFEKK